nr:E3 ubiquitin-protein ligase KEG [Tanacetum cinerariifolium]
VPSPVGTALSMAAAIKKEHEASKFSSRKYKFFTDYEFLIHGREWVQILLAAGADATAQDTQHGRTALHTAAMTNDVELVKVLVCFCGFACPYAAVAGKASRPF